MCGDGADTTGAYDGYDGRSSEGEPRKARKLALGIRKGKIENRKTENGLLLEGNSVRLA